MNPLLVNAKEAIKMATVNGAKALGFGETGCIKKGAKADLIILDIDKPHLCPINNPASAIVYSAQASDVDTVIVDGKILMEGRELKTIDEELVKAKVRGIISFQ
jgi:5-methylthioadenosine/S-adenosylhomocysteine deaminase